MSPPLAKVTINSLSVSLQFYSLFPTVWYFQVFLSPQPKSHNLGSFHSSDYAVQQLAFLAYVHARHGLACSAALAPINSLFCLISSQKPATPWVLLPVAQINKPNVNLLLIDYD